MLFGCCRDLVAFVLGFGAFDLWATLTAWPPYQEQYGAEMLAWIQSFPIWRKAIWGVNVGLGVIGSLMMFARTRIAGPALLVAFLLVAAGFAYDLALQDGVRHYGQQGLIASGVLAGLAALTAWAGYATARKAGQSSESAVEPSRAAPAAAAQSSTPAPTASPPPIAATIPAAPEVTIAPTAAFVSPAPTEAGDTDMSPPSAVEADEPSSAPPVEAQPTSSPALSDDADASSPTAAEPPAQDAKPPTT